VIFYADNQQTTVNSQGGQVFSQFRVVGAISARQLLFQVHPVRLVKQATSSRLHHI